MAKLGVKVPGRYFLIRGNTNTPFASTSKLRLLILPKNISEDYNFHLNILKLVRILF